MERKLLLLGLLRQQEMHGYQLYEFVDRYLSTCTDMKKSTAYFLLNKMGQDDWIAEEVSQEGSRPPRRVYRLTPFTLSRLGLNASGNAVIFVFVGVIVVAVQGGFIGPWSRRLGDRRLITMSLALLAIGLVLFAFTLAQPVPWYSEAAMTEELTTSGDFRTHENPTTTEVPIELPRDENTGWLGLFWVLVAMVPIEIGGAVLQPANNSLITKRVDANEVGGMLGISAALLSASNAIAPVIGGAVFQAVGPAMPYLLGGLLMGVLWVITKRLLKPGREQTAPAGLRRSAGGH